MQAIGRRAAQPQEPAPSGFVWEQMKRLSPAIKCGGMIARTPFKQPNEEAVLPPVSGMNHPSDGSATPARRLPQNAA